MGKNISFLYAFFPQAYQRGAAPKSRILPAGGKVLTSEDEYNLLSDRHFPDPLGELLIILFQGKMTKLLYLAEQCFSVKERDFPPGTFGSIWRHFFLSQLEGGCYGI